jgi:dihydroorotate dehydrogenase
MILDICFWIAISIITMSGLVSTSEFIAKDRHGAALVQLIFATFLFVTFFACWWF